jgi:hypothetical protein
MKSQKIFLILDDLHPTFHFLHVIRVDVVQLLYFRLFYYVVRDWWEFASNSFSNQFLLLGDIFGQVAKVFLGN